MIKISKEYYWLAGGLGPSLLAMILIQGDMAELSNSQMTPLSKWAQDYLSLTLIKVLLV